MKLVELDPKFLKHILEDGIEIHRYCEFDEADGIQFLCPKCFRSNSGRVGTHSIICWRPRIPQTVYPKPGRWEFLGTGISDLTLVAGSSSILLTSGCMWHGFIEGGNVRDA